MELPANILDALTAPPAYKVRRLLRSEGFVTFCKDRGEHLDAARLRKLEQLGLFKPLLRIRQPDDIRKIERVSDHQYRDLGSLEEDEVWTGETRTELLPFDFYPPVVVSWREHGILWSPFDGPSPHDPEIDLRPDRHEAFYSEFQIWDLMSVLSHLNLRVSADNVLNGDGTPSGRHDNLAESTAQMVAQAIEWRKKPNSRTAYALFAQLISDRFFVQTQGDQRVITLSHDGSNFHDWDWGDYARTWTPERTVSLFKLIETDSANMERELSAERRMSNPLSEWQSLTRFVALDQRKKLKGKALLAETLGEMAEMHRRFHELAFGSVLPDPNEAWFQRGGPTPTPAAVDPYAALEWVTNRFHLNPKPKLVLIVEGETEEAVIPTIFERWHGTSAARYGIQIRNMHGVGNATGTKKDVRSALWRIVDFLHAQQTLAFVLLDREGLAGKNIGEGLRTARSVHFPDRQVTRKEYIKLWRRCFELDNFNNREIAAAMSSLSSIAFVGDDIRPCRGTPSPRTKSTTIATVFEERTGQPLDKIALAHRLVDAMFDPACKRSPGNRPILRFLDFAAHRAALNHQPTTLERWEDNQRSGYVGTLRPGAVSRRRRRK